MTVTVVPDGPLGASTYDTAPGIEPLTATVYQDNTQLVDDQLGLRAPAWWKFEATQEGKVWFQAGTSRYSTGAYATTLIHLSVYTIVEGELTLHDHVFGVPLLLMTKAGTTYYVAVATSDAPGEVLTPVAYQLITSDYGHTGPWVQADDVTAIWAEQEDNPESERTLGIPAEPGYALDTNVAHVPYYTRDPLTGELVPGEGSAPAPIHFDGPGFYGHCYLIGYGPAGVDGNPADPPPFGVENEASGTAYSVASTMRWPGGLGPFSMDPENLELPTPPELPVPSTNNPGYFSGHVGWAVETFKPPTLGSGTVEWTILAVTKHARLTNFLYAVGPGARSGAAEADAAANPVAPNGSIGPQIEYENELPTFVELQVHGDTYNDGAHSWSGGASDVGTEPVRWSIWGDRWREPFQMDSDPRTLDEDLPTPKKWGPNQATLVWRLDSDTGEWVEVEVFDYETSRGSFGGPQWLGLHIPVGHEHGAPAEGDYPMLAGGWTPVPQQELDAALAWEAANPLVNDGGGVNASTSSGFLTAAVPEGLFGWPMGSYPAGDPDSHSFTGGNTVAYQTTIKPSRYRLTYTPEIPVVVGEFLIPGLTGELRDTGARFNRGEII